MSTFITRRAMLKYVAVASSAGVLAACAPKVVEVTTIVEREKIVEKPVEKCIAHDEMRDLTDY